MIKLFVKLFLVGLTVSAIAYIYYKYSYKIISYSEGPTTRQQIYQSIDNARKGDYELIFLGNSRIYRGMNPDKFSIRAYNFAHDNDSYNQAYYKLNYLKNDLKKNIKYLILGVDYFSFSYISDTRNYVYNRIFPPAYQKDYDTVKNYLSYKNQLNSKVNEFLTVNYTNTVFVFISSLKNKLLGRKMHNTPLIKSNGQFIKPGTASLQDKSLNHCRILDIQKSYFARLILFCQENGIKVLLLMPPSRSEELANFSQNEKNGFDQWIDSFADSVTVFYSNYSADQRFGINDFTDITHLSETAADRFSEIVNRETEQLFFKK